jgi:hypothetical protein
MLLMHCFPTQSYGKEDVTDEGDILRVHRINIVNISMSVWDYLAIAIVSFLSVA